MHRLCCAIAISLLSAATANAAPWTYRGTLEDGGSPAEGRYAFRLSLRDASGSRLIAYPQTLADVDVVEGRFAVDVDFGVDLTLLGALTLQAEVSPDGHHFVALGPPEPFDAKAALGGVCWGTSGNTGTLAGTDFLGTTDAAPLVLRASNVVGARLESTGGGINWTAGLDAQARTGSRAVSIGGGATQRVWTNGSTIAGGVNNVAGNASLLSPDLQIGATVGGGILNLARAQFSTVAGGSSNQALAESATVSGGNANRAVGVGATVGGGIESCAGGRASWAGGLRGVVRAANATDCANAAASSGDADGDEGSFVWSDATGAVMASTGPNQFLVRADGGVGINGAPASAGLELNVFGSAPFDGFVEFGLIPMPALNGNTGERVELGVGRGGADDNDADLRIVHRNNGSDFFEHLSIDGDGSVVVRSNPANTNVGVQLAVGAGSWSSLSDRAMKADIRAIEPLQVLERLLAMPIAQWRYRDQPGEVLHLGPMAQDFAAAFGLGENTTTIATVDADGVALAAIQGLNQKLERELAAARAENASLQVRLEQLAERLAAVEARGDR